MSLEKACEFLAVLQNYKDELQKENLRKKWYKLADMDIDAMDELAALITMEIYFAKGYKGILKGVYNEDEPWMSDGTIGYLHRRESLEEEGAEPDGMVRLYDEASHVKFVEKILYGEYVFMDSALRDYPYTIQAEYGHGPCWTGNTVQDAYLKNNIYRENGSLRPHGW